MLTYDIKRVEGCWEYVHFEIAIDIEHTLVESSISIIWGIFSWDDNSGIECILRELITHKIE